MFIRILNLAEKIRYKTLYFIVSVITMLLLLSCSCGKSVQNNSISHDTARATKQKDSSDTKSVQRTSTSARDSVFIHDSVYVFARGDTVFTDRWHTKTAYKMQYIGQTDTLYKYIDRYYVDTLKIKDTVIRNVETPLTPLQHIRMYAGDVFILLILLIVIYYLYKFNRNRT